MRKIFFTLVLALTASTFLSAKTLYCQMPYDWWWADDGQGNTAAISLYAYGDNGSNADWPGQLMTEIDAENHIWSIDIDLTGYNAIIFTRSSQNNDNWGAKTKDLPISEIGENDLYVISSVNPVWGDPGCDGAWSVYGAEPPVQPTYNTYHIYVTNNTGWDTFYLYEWGTPNEITGAWPGAQGDDFTFQVAEGANPTLHLIFHNNVGDGQEGDRRQLFEINEARDYTLVVTASSVTEGTTAVANANANAKALKTIVNGQIVILRDGKTFNILGTEL